VPPRYAYWTILIDDKPTAFRAREKDELVPTLHQLRRTNPNAQMKWFARGKLWDTREQEQAARQWRKASDAERPRAEKKGRDWRPGGEHKDPRDRFKKKHQDRGDRPWSGKPRSGPPRGDRPWRGQAPGNKGAGGKPSDAPGKRSGAAQVFRPAHKPRGDRRWNSRPPGGGARRDQPWREKPPAGSGAPKPREGGPAPPKPREGNEPPKRRQETPETPPSSEQIVTKPKPPERG
jgi:hypothetical protein